jgi:hypothetical protein
VTVVGAIILLSTMSVDRVDVADLDEGEDMAVLALVNDERLVLARPPDRGRVDTVSMPLQLIVSVPGIGHATLADAYEEGGATLLVDSVRSYTGVAIGRYIEIDRDLLLPVAAEHEDFEVCTDRARSDVDHVVRDAAVASKAIGPIGRPRTWLNPFRLVSTARATGKALAVDSGVSTGDLVRLPSGVRPIDAVTVATVPVQSVPDGLRALPEQAETLFQAFRSGDPLPTAIADLIPAEIDLDGVAVTVLNGAGVAGLASHAAGELRDRGLVVEDVGNAPESDKAATEVIYPTGQEEIATAVAMLFDGVPVISEVEEDERIIVVLGRDWADRRTLFEPEPVEQPTTVTARLVQSCG